MDSIASQPFTVGLVQMQMAADPAVNLRRARDFVAAAAAAGAQVVCLPEMYRSRYFCQQEDPAAFDLAEALDGPSTRAFRTIAKARRITVIVPIFERRAPGLYHNSLAVCTPDGRLAAHYRKMHIPDDPAYFEKYYFAPGDRGFQAVDTPVGPIGALICWDQWYPEAARLTALQGAQVLFYPTAIGWHPAEKAQFGAVQHDAWRTIQRSHAIANGVYVAAVNRVGFEPRGGDAAGAVGGSATAGIEFWGRSFLCDPFGEVLAEAPADGETILYSAVDPQRIEAVRRNWPFLRDRRIDAYGGLTARFLDGDLDPPPPPPPPPPARGTGRDRSTSPRRRRR
ncbi:MAG: carbon-nitrogen hydrolase [Planctomycetota bacterium]